MWPAGADIVPCTEAVTVFVFDAVWLPTAQPSAAAIATSSTTTAIRRPAMAPGLFTARRRYSDRLAATKGRAREHDCRRWESAAFLRSPLLVLQTDNGSRVR